MSKSWTKEEILEKIIEVSKRKETIKLKYFYAKNGLPSIKVIKNRFGSWNNALREASLPVNYPRYSNDEIINKLKEYASQIGHTPTSREVNEANQLPNIPIICRRFGSYKNALKIAGLDDSRYKIWSKEEVIEKIKYNYKKGISPVQSNYKKSTTENPDTNIVRNLFGSWNQMLIESGIGIKKKYKKTKRELIEELKKLIEKLGRAPKQKELDKFENISNSSVYFKHFGSYNNALIKAGIKPNEGIYGKIPRYWENLCEKIVKIKYGYYRRNKKFKNYGRPDFVIHKRKKIIECKTSSYFFEGKTFEQIEKYLSSGYDLEIWCIHKTEKEYKHNKVKYIYGIQLKKELENNGYKDLAERCEKFIQLNDDLRKEVDLFTKDQLIILLRKCANYLGRTPKRREIKDIDFMPSERPYITTFGSWNLAIKKAGLKLINKRSNDFYKNYKEAKIAVSNLDIKNCYEYRKNYKKDSRLPSNPNITYKDEWIDWYNFFDRKK